MPLMHNVLLNNNLTILVKSKLVKLNFFLVFTIQSNVFFFKDNKFLNNNSILMIHNNIN